MYTVIYVLYYTSNLKLLVNSNWKFDVAMTMLCSSRCESSTTSNQHSSFKCIMISDSPMSPWFREIFKLYPVLSDSNELLDPRIVKAEGRAQH
jgi:hypothetical protein